MQPQVHQAEHYLNATLLIVYRSTLGRRSQNYFVDAHVHSSLVMQALLGSHRHHDASQRGVRAL